VITIETDIEISPSLILKLDKKTDGKLNTFKKNDKVLKLVLEGNAFSYSGKSKQITF